MTDTLLDRAAALETARNEDWHHNWTYEHDTNQQKYVRMCSICGAGSCCKIHDSDACNSKIANALEDVRDHTIAWVESELREGFPMRLRVKAEKVRRKEK